MNIKHSKNKCKTGIPLIRIYECKKFLLLYVYSLYTIKVPSSVTKIFIARLLSLQYIQLKMNLLLRFW